MSAARTISLRERLHPRNLHPAQLLVLALATVLLAGTILLLTPMASRSETTILEAVFTATSALTVTGLTVVDTATHWTPAGQVVVLVLMQVGGLGIMTFASAIGIVVARRLGLRLRLIAAEEGRSTAGGELRSVFAGVLRISLLIEAIVAVLLTLRWLALGEPFGTALWHGVFHSISSFNNAGFALFSDSLAGFAGDPFILLPITFAVVLGSLGFPVLFELWRTFDWSHRPPAGGRSARDVSDQLARRRRMLTLNAKLVVATSIILLFGGALAYALLEWNNPRTLAGTGDAPARLMNALLQSAMTRSGGLTTYDTAALYQESWVVTDVLMFIGGGPAGTGGGIKLTTFAVLVLVVVSEVRGDDAVSAFGRRLPRSVQREAITVLSIATVALVGATILLMLLTDFDLDHALFEVVSAFSTVGLTVGGTSELSPAGLWLLIVLMFAGRVGPVTLASALALRSQRRLYEYPKERPLIG